MNKLPLCVDLDHSLINTDLTFEAIIESVKANPLNLIIIIKFIILGQKKELKTWLANHVELEWSKLPKNLEVEEFINQEIKNGREVFLVSGSHQKYLTKIHRIFPNIKESIGTSEEINLLEKIKQII